jgi:hypothetical protein
MPDDGLSGLSFKTVRCYQEFARIGKTEQAPDRKRNFGDFHSSNCKRRITNLLAFRQVDLRRSGIWLRRGSGRRTGRQPSMSPIEPICPIAIAASNDPFIASSRFELIVFFQHKKESV